MNRTSSEIERFMHFLDDTKSKYGIAMDAMKTEEKRTQDLLHAIEFASTAKERNKLCTKLRQSRVERRKNKDIVEDLEPIIEFLEDGKHKVALNSLTLVLGKVRKAEKYHENRYYIPRVEKGDKNK